LEAEEKVKGALGEVEVLGGAGEVGLLLVRRSDCGYAFDLLRCVLVLMLEEMSDKW
jgi:hypothetical protein